MSTSTDAPIRVDPIQRRVSVNDITAALDTVASDLKVLWTSALEGGDSDEIGRLVEASHAVHRAGLALRSGTVSATWRSPYREHGS